MFAHASLKYHGFSSYLPHRVYRVKGLKEKTELLFQSYILIQFDVMLDPWQLIKNLPGINSLLPLHKEIPEPLPEGFVEELMKIELAQKHISPRTKELTGVEIGDKVKVEYGVFDAMGKFEGINNGVASVLLKFLGHESAFNVPMAFVRPV